MVELSDSVLYELVTVYHSMEQTFIKACEQVVIVETEDCIYGCIGLVVMEKINYRLNLVYETAGEERKGNM
jgi:hypothetical protein